MQVFVGRVAFYLHALAMFVALPAIATIIGVDVVLRYFFHSPLLWSFEANSLFMLIAVFGTIPYVTSQNRHIRMALVYRNMGQRFRATVDLLAALAGATFSSLLCYQMVRNVPSMIQDNEAGEFFEVQFWPFALFLAFIGATLTFQFFLNALITLGVIDVSEEGS